MNNVKTEIPQKVCLLTYVATGLIVSMTLSKLKKCNGKTPLVNFSISILLTLRCSSVSRTFAFNKCDFPLHRRRLRYRNTPANHVRLITLRKYCFVDHKAKFETLCNPGTPLRTLFYTTPDKSN